MADAPLGMMDHLNDAPNIVTLANISLGATSLMLLADEHPRLAAVAIVWCVYLDYLDGHLARAQDKPVLHRRHFGQQLDTLADLVSFSVVPGLFLFSIGGGAFWAGVLSLLFPLCGAVRLAYFNLYGLETGRFVGLPTTYAAALFILLMAVTRFIMDLPVWLPSFIAPMIALSQVVPVAVPKLRVPLIALFICAAGLSILILAEGKL